MIVAGLWLICHKKTMNGKQMVDQSLFAVHVVYRYSFSNGTFQVVSLLETMWLMV